MPITLIGSLPKKHIINGNKPPSPLPYATTHSNLKQE